MSNLQTRLRELRKENKLTQAEMAQKLRDKYGLKTDRVMVSKWETGFQVPEIFTITCIAEMFGVSLDYLNGKETDGFFVKNKLQSPGVTEDVVSIPVIGEIAAGYDKLAVADWSSESIDVPRYFLKGRKPEEFFFLTVKGDSMYPEYREGDKVMILRQETLNYSGQVGAVIYGEGNATLKKVEFVPGEDWMNLIAINPTVPPMRIEGPDLEQCRILGIPKYLIREYE